MTHPFVCAFWSAIVPGAWLVLTCMDKTDISLTGQRHFRAQELGPGDGHFQSLFQSLFSSVQPVQFHIRYEGNLIFAIHMSFLVGTPPSH